MVSYFSSMKILIKILAILFVIAFLFCVGVYFYLQSTSTDYNFSYSSNKVENDVRVVFDDMAVPHIYADSENDAMFALGYVHASERLWQMDLLRRAGGGELSELLGEDMIENDKYLRTLGMRTAAIKDAEAFSKSSQENIIDASMAYMSGINTFIDKGDFPIEYTILGATPAKFLPEDMYKIAGFMAYSFAIHIKTEPIVDFLKSNFDSTYVSDLALGVKGFTKIPTKNAHLDVTAFSDLATFLDEKLPITQFIGSNAWVIAGDKTESGEVIFCNDTHMKYSSPSVWYEAHIITPELEYYGNHIAGVPFPPLGHTKERAWGITMFVNDDVDFYSETLKNGQYLHDGVWHDLEVAKEVIHVAGGEDVELEIRSTMHGPLIDGNVSLWWAYTQYPENNIHTAFYELSRAESLEEVASAAEKIHAPGLNIMHGDSEGNIAWWAAAKLPIRRVGADSKSIQDGSLAENEILGWYDFSKNPSTINPESGYVFSTNNSPEEVDGIHYPGYYYGGNTRAASIIKTMTSGKSDWTLEDVQQLQLSTDSPVYNSNCKMMVEHISGKNSFEGVYAECFNKMLHWKGTHESHEIEPTIYYRWMHAAIKGIFKDELGDQKYLTFRGTIVCENTFPMILANSNSPWWDNVNEDESQSASEILTSAFYEAVDEISSARGSDFSNWQYGKLHHLTHEHAMGKVELLAKLFNVGPYELPSAKDALCKYEFKLKDTVDFEVFSGPAMRVSVDFGDVNASESVLPTGQSGNVFSPYFNNQADLYHSGKFRLQRMDFDEIKEVMIGESFIKTE